MLGYLPERYSTSSLGSNGVIRLASPRTVEGFARDLYAALRLADTKNLDVVVVLQPGGDGLAEAIRDRLARSAYGN